jgi:hypothetical protein
MFSSDIFLVFSEYKSNPSTDELKRVDSSTEKQETETTTINKE